MKRRNLRIGILTTTILTFISNTAAQITVGDTEYSSLTEFIVEFYGFPTSIGSVDALGYVAGFGVFTAIYYFGIETAIRRSGSDKLLEATGLEGYNNSGISRRLAVLSILSVLSIFSFGAGAFEASVASFASIMMFGIIGLVAVFGLFILAGLVAGTRDAGGTAAREGAGIVSDLHSGYRQTRETLEEVRTADEEGNEDRAIEGLEEVVRELRYAEQEVDELLEHDIQDLEDAMTVLRQEVNNASDDMELTHEIEDLLGKLNANLQQILDRRTDAGFTDDDARANILEVRSALEQIKDDMDTIGHDIVDARDPMRNALETVVEEGKQIAEAVPILKALEEVIEDSEMEWEHLHEEIHQDRRLDVEKDQMEQLEEMIKNELEPLENQAINLLEEAESLIEDRLKFTRGEARQLVEMLENNGQVDQHISDVKSILTSAYTINPSDEAAVKLNEAKGLLNDIQSEIGKIEQYDTDEYEMEEKALEQIKQALSQLNN